MTIPTWCEDCEKPVVLHVQFGHFDNIPKDRVDDEMDKLMMEQHKCPGARE